MIAKLRSQCAKMRIRYSTHCLVFLVFFSFVGHTENLIRIDGSTGVKPLIESLAQGFEINNANFSFEIGKGMKPNVRIKALLNNEIDIAMASHGVNPLDIAHQGLQLHLIAKTAVVIGANHSVSVKNISYQQLCDIYDNKITNWQTLGGKDYAIIPYTRPFDEVDSEVLREHIPCFAQLRMSTLIEIKAKSGQMARALSETSGAIGMTTQVRVAQSKGTIKALSLNDALPITENLLLERYPLTRDLFVITSTEPSFSITAFLDFIRSQAGREIILSNNAIPVTK